jgi:carbonic anhydrase
VPQQPRQEACVWTSASDTPIPASIEEGVREDVARLRTTPLIPPGLAVHGLVYDVRTGRLTTVPE